MEFTVENVLFYHRCARVRQRAEPFIAAEMSLPPYIREDLARIYVTFVRQNAGYQVQLDVVTREYIEERFARGTADASVFDQAVEQVIQQMYSKTFPRFLDWRASRKRRWPQLCGYQNIQLPEQQEIYYQ
ncbi:hypothetical protein BDF19DRAFT_456214 [Syncephalis fuscata]|nr:hypothetical protein BDF19DRAFT_456214 [Syncephalis fuscata]